MQQYMLRDETEDLHNNNNNNNNNNYNNNITIYRTLKI